MKAISVREAKQHLLTRRGFRFALALAAVFTPRLSAAQDTDTPPPLGASPLSTKQEMIRDRYQRFEDRVYRLREQLEALEPENAARLARALERSGEAALAEQLEAIIRMLGDPSALTEATDAQGEWIENAESILNVLLERDSENDERKDELQRLNEYRKEVAQLLDAQRSVRGATAQAAMNRRMSQQIDQAIQRLDALRKRQAQLSEKTGRDGDAAETESLSDEQAGVARDTKQLAEELRRIAEQAPAEDADTPSLEGARGKVGKAGEHLQGGERSMSKAEAELDKGNRPGATDPQKEAEEALKRAREQLEAAKKALEKKTEPQQSAKEQGELAEKTQGLTDRMRKDAAEGGSQGSPKSSGKPGDSSSPGLQNLDQAKNEMGDATKSLKKDRPADATPQQDRAIEELEQAQRELEKVLSQLRKEERAERLRDLEARFREMLANQRTINEATSVLHGFGHENFQRAHRLQLAKLAADERSLSKDANACLHVLEEDATTVVFPRVVEQLVEDMDTVGKRLAELKVASLTQRIENEIVETLEQLIGAVQQMQQENEQGGGMSKPGNSKDQPLLPTSAELKLLRASQYRINTRTTAIEQAILEGSESEQTSDAAFRTLAARQKECSDIARDIHDNQKMP